MRICCPVAVRLMSPGLKPFSPTRPPKVTSPLGKPRAHVVDADAAGIERRSAR